MIVASRFFRSIIDFIGIRTIVSCLQYKSIPNILRLRESLSDVH